MDEFNFNQFNTCTNPKAIRKSFGRCNYFEITTAKYKEKWGVGISFWGLLRGCMYGVFKDRCNFASERDALLEGIALLRKKLNRNTDIEKQMLVQLQEIHESVIQPSLFD